jgi:CBS domain containing-hemolysin-like protein
MFDATPLVANRFGPWIQNSRAMEVAMQTIPVIELMVPLADYATVDEDGTLYSAVLALEQTRERFDPKRAEHRAVLVLNRKQRVVGKVSYLDILLALEPKYEEVEELKHTTSTFTPEFIRSLLQRYNLWAQPLDDLCRKAARVRVKDIMHTPSKTEFIDEDTTLNEAVHRLIVERQQSLLITRREDVVGVLRLSDVVEKVCGMIKACDFTSPETQAGRQD